MRKHDECTNSDFILFIEYCRYWQSKLRLGDWEIDFKFKDEDADKYADCEYDLAGLRATITLYKGWTPTNVTKTELKETAYHEVAHLLFAGFFSAAVNGETDEKTLRLLEHEILKRLTLCNFHPRKHK